MVFVQCNGCVQVAADVVVMLCLFFCLEATAADQAGCKVLLVLREGNAPLTNEDLKICKTVSSFNEILLDWN